MRSAEGGMGNAERRMQTAGSRLQIESGRTRGKTDVAKQATAGLCVR
jgi:hypothetical protein